jgi:hypothetical protein
MTTLISSLDRDPTMEAANDYPFSVHHHTTPRSRPSWAVSIAIVVAALLADYRCLSFCFH